MVRVRTRQARRALAAQAWPGAEGVAQGLGFRVIPDPGMPAGAPGIHHDGLIIVRPQRDAARWEAIIFHETPHAAFRREGIRHEHADVWASALALGCPLETALAHADRSPADLAAACGVPWWFAWMRIETMPDSTGIRVA